jgi:hypothetical protein
MHEETDYDDGKVACTSAELVIRGYYFPWGTKKIRYDRIQDVTVSHRRFGRIWGSSDLVHWYNLDPKRLGKEVGLVVRSSRRVRQVITPDRPDEAIAALRSHGVTVSD